MMEDPILSQLSDTGFLLNADDCLCIAVLSIPYILQETMQQCILCGTGETAGRFTEKASRKTKRQCQCFILS